ncbi:hypothetical protein ACEZCY_24675 [Streptacidiphilus sp. N1-12]|uniref:YCII-related domain-containing protein n=2 Tax=Streptacidiphilus alkalitolerans TaxID=3342712 RepID=A0ABV6WK30_9ACTN
MAPEPVPPRILTQAERDVLALLLSADFEGAQELRSQLDHTQVVAVWAAGSPSVDLAVPGGIGKAQVADGEIPVGAEVHDPQGNYLGEITVWVTSGLLSAIEYSWVTDEPPTRLPDTAALRLVQ